MDQFTIANKVSAVLSITEQDALRVLHDSFTQDDPFNALVDLLGYENIELIFEIFKNKDAFNSIEHKNDQAIYVEHIIPAFNKVKHDKELIKTAVLGDNAKYFSYKTFNPVQSAVFNNIYKSDENILVSAPTGAGKTDIALLSILRALRHEKAQIIYIVPMKALANEIFNKYKKVFTDQCSVIEYTGDTEIDNKTAKKARIIVCTPEKFDVATRRLCCVFQSIRLIVIDEIHLLEDDRGPVLEALVARSFITSELTQSKIRIVGLSATLPNYRDVAEFIKATHVHFFDTSYRPVPLKMIITGFAKESNYSDEKQYLVMKVQEYLDMKKQIIIFVNSRAGTLKTAKFLLDNLTLAKNVLKKMPNLDSSLISIVCQSIGIHHAGLLRKDRLLMEGLFKEGTLKVLVCTSTLAWGVNLPAYAVIIHGASYYNSVKGTFDDIGILDVLQIFGRAGRPQFDSKGEAVLITSCKKTDKYVNLLKRSEDIESKMLYNFPESINSEIFLHNIFSIGSALAWIKNTFLYVRMMKNPAKYGILFEDLGLEEQALSEYIYLTIKFLEDSGLIFINKIDTNYNTWTFKPTVYGQIASVYYLSAVTMYNWLKEMHLIHDEYTLVKCLLKSKEFECITVRSDEIGYLTNIHQELLLDSVIDWEFDETTESKLHILFISFITFRQMPIFSLSCDMEYLIDNLKRLVSAMKDILLSLKRYELFKILFILSKKIKRERREKLINCDVQGIRINDNFIEIEISKNIGHCALFIYDKKDIGYVSKLSGSCRHIAACKSNHITVEIHTEEKWLIKQQNLELKTDLSINGLYKYGTHCCDSTFNLAGRRNDCIHFQVIPLCVTLENALKLSGVQLEAKTDSNDAESIGVIVATEKSKTKESHLTEHIPKLFPKAVLPINKTNIHKKVNDEETYNNVIDLSYTLNITFKIIEISNFKDGLKFISMEIDDLELQNALIVCPHDADVNDTKNYLNTKAALSKKPTINKFGTGKTPTLPLWICCFSDAHLYKGFDTIVFKGVSDYSGLYSIGNIYRIADKKKTIIFESPTNVEYLKTIYK